MHWVIHTNARTNQCTLPLWSIHASLDYSHGTWITDAGPAQAIIFSGVNEDPHPKKKETSALTHKQILSPANHSYCHRQTPFIYENGMSVIFRPHPPMAHANEKKTHTCTRCTRLHYRSATDQLSC